MPGNWADAAGGLSSVSRQAAAGPAEQTHASSQGLPPYHRNCAGITQVVTANVMRPVPETCRQASAGRGDSMAPGGG